jgi:hypothetical protein
MLDALKNAASNAASSVADVGRDAALSAASKAVEKQIKENLKAHGFDQEIEVEMGYMPSDDNWKEWMRKTGFNSLCTEGTWRFLEASSGNQRKRDLWKERGIKKIILAVDDECDSEMSGWSVCEVEWKQGDNFFTIWFDPYAKSWWSDRMWIEDGYKRYWTLDDEIVFGLQLYQLPGKCFYKSDWLDGVEDPDPDSPSPWATKKFKRWFQFRHWIIFWYSEARSGWNYQYTTKPPSLPDGSLFNLDAVLKLPSMPDLKMPAVKLPSLPNVEMPSLPSMPSMPDMPSISAPSLPSLPSMPSMPSLGSLPSLGSIPSLPDKPKRPTGRWDCHGFIELEGLHAKANGKNLILSGANITHFWQDGAHHVKDEKKEKQKMELEATSDEQATSWVQSLLESGVKEGETGGCCNVA